MRGGSSFHKLDSEMELRAMSGEEARTGKVCVCVSVGRCSC